MFFYLSPEKITVWLAESPVWNPASMPLARSGFRDDDWPDQQDRSWPLTECRMQRITYEV